MSIFKKLTLSVFVVILTLSLSLQSANAGKVTINLGHGGGEKSAYQPLATKFAELAAKFKVVDIIGTTGFSKSQLKQIQNIR